MASGASVPWVAVKLITWDWTVTLSLSGDPVSRQERKAMRLEPAAYPGHCGKKTTPFLFIYLFFTCFNPPVCPFDLCIWLKSETRFTRAIGHQYVPVWRYWKVMAAPLPPLTPLWRKEMSELFPNILLYKANWPHLKFSLKNNIFPKPRLTVATPGKRSIFQWHMGLWGLQW